jgi:hypothetical protein
MLDNQYLVYIFSLPHNGVQLNIEISTKASNSPRGARRFFLVGITQKQQGFSFPGKPGDPPRITIADQLKSMQLLLMFLNQAGALLYKILLRT